MGFFDAIKGLLGGSDKPSGPMAWILAACAIVTDVDDDPADWPADESRESLSTWWELEDRGAVLGRLEELLAGTSAWDHIRALHVARMAQSAGYLNATEALSFSVRAGAAVQKTHRNWQELALAYWASQREWAAESGADVPDAASRQQTMGRLHLEAWSGVDFQMPLRG